jgi:hypothetical protein
MRTVQEALQKSGLTTPPPERPDAPPPSSEMTFTVGSAGGNAGGNNPPPGDAVAFAAPTGNPPATNVAQVGATDSPGSAVSGAGIHVAQVTSPGNSAVGNPPDFNIINGQPWGGSPTVVAMNTGPSDAGGPVRVPAALGGAGDTGSSNAVGARAPSIMTAGAAPVTGGAGPLSPVGSGGNPLA